MWWWICKEGKMFDDVIEYLCWADGHADPLGSQVKSAIRVLEAAAKVDKAELLSMAEWKLKCFEHTYGPELKSDNHWVNKDIAWWQMLRALLAALPDAPKDGGK
jgi:hypothetical protein